MSIHLQDAGRPASELAVENARLRADNARLHRALCKLGRQLDKAQQVQRLALEGWLEANDQYCGLGERCRQLQREVAELSLLRRRQEQDPDKTLFEEPCT